MEGWDVERCGLGRSTYISDGWIVLNRNHSKGALGVPIEYSALHSLPFHSAIMLIVCPGLEEGTRSYHIDQICDLAVVRAWSLKYYGNAHKVLLKTIDDLYTLPIERNYAKIIPIAQSSGTGNPRLWTRMPQSGFSSLYVYAKILGKIISVRNKDSG
jgi:hypothetical protein